MQTQGYEGQKYAKFVDSKGNETSIMAGKEFTDEGTITNDGKKSWVVPNYNVDGDTYDKVRGIDKILQVLTSHKEMQFTHTQSQTDSEKNN